MLRSSLPWAAQEQVRFGLSEGLSYTAGQRLLLLFLRKQDEPIS